MSTKAVEIAVRMSADASDVERAFDGAGDAAIRMANDVDSATRDADMAASRLDGVASSAGDLDDAAGKTTGALGALSAGFEVVGMEKYAAGLQTAAMATDGLSGVGQITTLMLESQKLAAVRAKVALIAHTVATKAIAAASKVWAATQWALNAALAANPIGLVVLAVVALVAIIVVAYKKSETFRAVVQVAMKLVTTYIETVVKIVETLVEFVRDKAPAAWDKLKDKAVAAASWISDKVGGSFEDIIAPIEWVIDKVGDLIDLIGKIDFPDMPSLGDLNPLGKVSLPSIPGLGRFTGGELTPTVDARTYVTVDGSGIVDEAAIARALEPVLIRHATRMGRPPVGGVVWS
jgi:hypothetical protein